MEVAMVMVLVGMANGTLGDIADRLQNVGADVLFQPPDASLLLGATSAVMPVKLADLITQVEGVRYVAPVLNWHVSQIRGESRAVNLWAVDQDMFPRISGGFDIVDGHTLRDPYDLVMDTVLANATGMKVGDPLPMLNQHFRIAGICRAGAGGRLYARLADIQEAIGTPGKASFFLVKGLDSRDADQLTVRLQERFKGYKITPMAQVSKIMQQNVVGLQQFKEALTGMAVVISFLVVLLAMYTTIIERTREIGILRAMGASQRTVVQYIIGESFLICLAGVVAGIGLGILGAWGIPAIFPTLTVQLSSRWALIASALGLVGGLLGSFYPAWRAARLDPIQSLNFE
jgi:putative ABC transport system permease protein